VKRHEKTIHAVEYEALQAVSKDVKKPKAGHKPTNSGVSTDLNRANMITEVIAAEDDVTASLLHENSILDLDLGLTTQETNDIPIDPELYSQMYNLPSPLPSDSPGPFSQRQNEPSGGRDVFDLDGLDFLDTMAVEEDTRRSFKRARLESAPDTATHSGPSGDTSGKLQSLHPLPDTFDVSLFTEFFAMDDTFMMPDLPYTPSNSDGTSPEQHNVCPPGVADTGRNYQNPSLAHSQKLFRRLPHVLQDKSNSPPRIEVDQLAYESILNDVTSRMSGEDCSQILPGIQDMRRFIGGYLDCFHRHLPIIHLPSLKIADTPSPLVLALTCIGALYQLDRRRAALSYQLSLRLLQKVGVLALLAGMSVD
jgi:hypothetical protein